MSLPQLTHETYTDFVASNPFAVVHCWAVWNGYDHQMRSALADQMPHFPQIAFAEFDVDPPDHHDICRELNVHGPPFLALYRDGVFVTSRVGLMDRADLRAFLDGLLNPAAQVVQHGFYAGAFGTPSLFGNAGWPWYTFPSSDIVRFVQGGVVKTFRCVTSVLPNATPYDIGCQPSPSVPAETVIADGWCTYLLFFAVSQDLDSNGKLTDMRVAVLRCDHCVSSRFGYPNDEGFAEHPLYDLCREIDSSVIQIDDSDWLRSLQVQIRGSAQRIWGDKYKPSSTVLSHFLLELKEKTFECIAESLTVECYCDTFDAAFAHVMQRLSEH